MEYFRSLDAYPKLRAEDQQRTTHGACLSFVALAAMSYLFAKEFAFYSKIEVVDKLRVQSTHGEHLSVKFDVRFPHVPCDLLSLDALDTAGQKQEGVIHHIIKTKIHPLTLLPKSHGEKIEGLESLGHFSFRIAYRQPRSLWLSQ